MKDLDDLNELADELHAERTDDSHEETEENLENSEEFESSEELEGGDDQGEEQLTETLVVDGEEVEENVDELLEAGKRAKQKELAADAKFQEAAQLQRELDERAAHLSRLEEELSAQREKVQSATSKNASELFAEALVADEKKAGEMFAQTLARQKELEDKLAAMDGTLQQVNRVTEMQVRNQGAELNRYYHDKYGDIAENDVLHKVAMDNANAIRSQNPNLSEFEVIDQSAEKVKVWVKTLTGGNKAIEKKRNMQKQPAKAGGRTRGKPAFKPETREDVLAQMQASKAFS